MNKNLKNAIGVIALLAGIVVTISLGYLTYTYGKSVQPSGYRTFSVTGEGKVTAIPDIAHFTFSVISEGKDLAALQTDNTTKTNKAIDYLKQSGVEAKDISTESYNVYPQYQYYNCTTPDQPCPPPTISGYSVQQTVSVKVRSLDKSGSLIAGVVQNGANSVSQLDFTIDDPSALEAQAREKAIAQAKVKAEGIAKAGGFRLGNLLSIEEGQNTPVPPIYYSKDQAVGMGGAPTAAPTPNIQPGSQEITITVTLHYEIK